MINRWESAIRITPVTWCWLLACALACLLAATQASAERQPVLRQIDVPHDYYFREMYLPQMTSGPQSPAWSPDGRHLVYSMQGSLWRQALDSMTAVQLTNGPGYDYQPDWSPDGGRIVFTRYFGDAMELHVLDLDSGAVIPITDGGQVNLEPRWSPDGSRLAFVSTAGSGRFHVFVGELDGRSLDASAVLAERQSDVARYYYSSYDHEISPSWAPDGRSLLFVSNPEIPYGSGAIWSKNLDEDSDPQLIRMEETTWRARPDMANDGRRVIYTSYLGRQWHQLWITAAEAKGEPFPLTYGDYDVVAARWSPDSESIAFVANEGGNTSLRVISIPGGKTVPISIEAREYLVPMGTLELAVADGEGAPTAARVSVVGADGRSYAPHSAWMHADDSFDRGQRNDELRYFHSSGHASVDLPVGKATVTVWQGMERQVSHHVAGIQAGTTTKLDASNQPLALPESWNNWLSGDVHVHMNYGGTYRNTPANLVQQAEAEDLDIVFNLIVNKEQRVPDIAYFSGQADAESNDRVILQHSQEFHTGYWGHLGLLGLSDHLLLPDYSAYPETAAASLYPDNAAVENMAREQGGLAGYVHPFMYPLPDPVSDDSLTHALPIDAALGLVDFYEVVGFADHQASAEIWYRLLNCGIRISAAGGTDAMANFASLRGPVGINRTYAMIESAPDNPDARRDAWLQSLKAGSSLATNGPLLGLTVEGRNPGALIELRDSGQLRYRGFMRSIVPVDHLELVLNGEVVRSVKLDGDSAVADFDGSIEVTESGWLLLRTYSDNPHPDILDMYPYATTSPVYVNVGGESASSPADADYFLAWIERARESAAVHGPYNSAVERERVLKHIDDAAQVFRDAR